MFHKNLKNIRLKQGLSQKQVALYLNISPQSISKWEKGEALPSLVFLPKLSQCLNCDINAFFEQINKEVYDTEMFEGFFSFIEEHIYKETKKDKDFIPFLNKYPNILDDFNRFSATIEQYKTIKNRNIQELFACSENQAKIFVDYLIKLELIEKLDLNDLYFVLKDSFFGLRIILKTLVTICNDIK